MSVQQSLQMKDAELRFSNPTDTSIHSEFYWVTKEVISYTG